MSKKDLANAPKRGKFTEVLEQLVGAIAQGFTEEFSPTNTSPRPKTSICWPDRHGSGCRSGLAFKHYFQSSLQMSHMSQRLLFNYCGGWAGGVSGEAVQAI
ncbi:MAG: hypothetical protein HXX11_21965 [Desulfuromonadales bacterium]|nr:hypothetical protein [Desulfuromonadales bacterium]